MARQRGGKKRHRSDAEEALIQERLERRRKRRQERADNQDDNQKIHPRNCTVVSRNGELMVHEGTKIFEGYRQLKTDDGKPFWGSRSEAFIFKSKMQARFAKSRNKRGKPSGHRAVETEVPVFAVTKGPRGAETQFVVRRYDEDWPRGWFEVKGSRTLSEKKAALQAEKLEKRRRGKNE